jgi:hypothetical protein
MRSAAVLACLALAAVILVAGCYRCEDYPPVVASANGWGDPDLIFSPQLVPQGAVIRYAYRWPAGCGWHKAKPSHYGVDMEFGAPGDHLNIEITDIQRDSSGWLTSYKATYTGTVGGAKVEGSTHYPG